MHQFCFFVENGIVILQNLKLFDEMRRDECPNLSMKTTEQIKFQKKTKIKRKTQYFLKLDTYQNISTTLNKAEKKKKQRTTEMLIRSE